MDDLLEEIDALDIPERVALVALLKFMVTVDGQVSREEAIALSQVAGRVGPKAFQAADAITLTDEAAVSAFLKTVGRQRARDAIHDVLAAAAGADGIEAKESSALALVAREWGVVTGIE